MRGIRYEEMVRELLRSILADVASNGLSGEQHLYITIDTQEEGVDLSSRLREQFPTRLTIVLQHQFWGLHVTEHSFEVEVSFSGIVERLRVPFSAIVFFCDPSVPLALQIGDSSQFEELDRPGECETQPSGASQETVASSSISLNVGQVVQIESFRRMTRRVLD